MSAPTMLPDAKIAAEAPTGTRGPAGSGSGGYGWLLETLRQYGFECEVRSGNPALISGAPGAPPVTLYARQVRQAPVNS